MPRKSRRQWPPLVHVVPSTMPITIAKNIYRMIPPLLPSTSKLRDQVFSRTPSFPKGPLNDYNFHKVVQFSGSHPREGYSSSSKSVCSASLGTVPKGMWLALLMRFLAWRGIYALHGEELTIYSLCLHHQQCTRTTPEQSWGFCAWWPENNSTDNSISLTCFHLTFAPGCWLGWAQHVCGRQYTSCPVQTATAFLARADPGKYQQLYPLSSLL